MTGMETLNEVTMPRRPRRVRHWNNLMWWIIVIAASFGVREVLSGDDPRPASTAWTGDVNLREKEAFIALVFGRVSATREMDIPAAAFEAQIASLKRANFSSIRLEEADRWRQFDATALPPKPVLLTFEEPHRETMAIADAILAKEGMTAVVFVDVDQLDKRSIQLVSWHRLEELANNGRWEIGVSGCASGGDQAWTSAPLLATKFARQRNLLERRLNIPVIAADCTRAWHSNYRDAVAVWSQALPAASMQVGFVTAPVGANYREDSELSYKRVRVARTWGPADLVSQLEAHAPRRAPFAANFEAGRYVADWVVDSGKIAIEDGTLRLFSKSDEQGGLLVLGGTDKWRDAEVAVRLQGQPDGQFWIFLRHRIGQAYVRLGVADGQVMLQGFDGVGVTSVLASQPLPVGDIALRLRVVGSRALAYLNGQALSARPVEVPRVVGQGAFALAVWQNAGDVLSAGFGKASVRIAQVSATPVSSKGGLVGSVPGDVAWRQLRQESEQFSMVSPSYFGWAAGKPQSSHERDISLEIFAYYHRIALQPALFIEQNTSVADASTLIEQAVTWASAPAFHGLNVIVQSSMMGEHWRAIMAKLEHRLESVGKTLAVTVLDSQSPPMPANTNDGLVLIASHEDESSMTAGMLHPLGPTPAYVLQAAANLE